MRLRETIPAYRAAVWNGALAEHGVTDAPLADEMSATFIETRSGLHIVYPDVHPVLEVLREHYALAVVTNGLACLQREKLVSAGLGGYPQAVVTAGDVGRRKPEPAVFLRALELLGVDASEALMIGNSLRSDIGGGAAAGLGTIWLNRQCAPLEGDQVPDAEIESLFELPPLLGIALGAPRDPVA